MSILRSDELGKFVSTQCKYSFGLEHMNNKKVKITGTLMGTD